MDEWSALWERAKHLERILPRERKRAFTNLKSKYPELPYKTWAGVSRAIAAGTLRPPISADANNLDNNIKALAVEALQARRESERLLAAKLAADKRPWLDPTVHRIPPGPYSKLRNCTQYPLRASCNYGENAEARWNRCEYMQNAGGVGRWHCTARHSLTE